MTGQVEALTLEGAHRGHLGEQDARPGDRRGGEVLGGRQRLLGGQRADPLQRLETDGANHDQLAGQRLQQQLGLPDQRADLRLDPGRVDQLLEVLQPGTALPAECHGVGLAGMQPIDEGVRA